MTTVLITMGCGLLLWYVGYLTGERRGIKAARQAGQLAVEAERARCKRTRLTTLFGPEIVRPSMAGRN